MFKSRLLNFRFSGLKTVIFSIFILNILSLAAIFSSLHQAGLFGGEDIIKKQITWLFVSWIFLVIFSFINYRFYYDLAFVIYIINLGLLIFVYFFGKSAMGAQRWLSLFGFTFQPSELSKLATVILLARLFSSQGTSLLAKFLLPLGLIGLNALIIVKQPDLGTALMLLFMFFGLGMFSGLKKRYFVYLLIASVAAVPFFWHNLKGYQKKRLVVFINPNVDPLGSGYTIIQSKIAIGSGKITGKGFLAGTQNQFNFLPERHTDFIFTVIAEEWGFLGSIFVLMLYWFILRKMLQTASVVRDSFAFFLSAGISLLFFFHIFVNIGMTLGILPVVGLPLVFLSYGGTNLLINFILIGIYFNICRKQI